MTDRFHSLVVVLEKDVHEDDAEPIMAAIRMLRGVISVSGEVTNLGTHAAEERARHEFGKRLMEVLYPKRTV